MIRKNNYQVFGILLFLIFIFTTFLVQRDLFRHIDYNTTVKIQDIIPDFLIPFFSLFSLLGSAEIASLILLLILITMLKTNRIVVLFFYFVLLTIELLGKNIIVHSGPPIELLKTKLLISFPSDHIPHEFFSYPSGHSARTAFVSGLLLLTVLMSKKLNKFQKRIAIFLIILFDFFMFFSRIYLGEHWISDVLGGSLLGFSLVLTCALFINKKPA